MVCCLQLQRLDMEARSASVEESAALVKKVKDYRKDLQKLNADVKRAGSIALSRGGGEASSR